VIDAMERIQFSGLLNNGRSDQPVVGEGVEPAREARLGTHLEIIDGRNLQDTDTYGVLVGEGLAKALRLRPGDNVTLLLNVGEGAINTQELDVVGTFRSFSKDFDARAIRMHLDAAHDLLRTNGANTIVVSLEATRYTGEVERAILARIDRQRFEVKAWPELNDFYEKTVALYERQFGVLQIIVLVLVLLSVANSVNMSVFERTGEFGTMRALGNRGGVVFRLVVVESVLVGLLGALIGLIVGLILATAISTAGIPMPPPPNANVGYTAQIRLVPTTLILSFAVGFCATVLACLNAARRVSRTPIIAALRQNT
jgi:putative ABC transport system permease protein